MSTASAALQQWIEETESLEPDERAPALRTTDLAGGFAALAQTDQDRLLQLLMHVGPRPDWELLIAAIGSTKATEALEAKLLPLWLERSDRTELAGEYFVLYALLHGRGKDAARVVMRLRKFSAYAGLIASLDSVMTDLPLDDELLGVAARAMRACDGELDAMVIWGLAAHLLHHGRPQDMAGVVGAFYAVLSPPHPSPRRAGRLCDIIDTHARSEEAAQWAARWAPRLRAVLALYEE